MNGAFSKKSASRFLPRVAVSKRAFTIVELIIVITVIGILTAIVTISYDAVLTNSREESMKADLQSTYAKLKVYKDANGEYPASLGASEVKSDDGTTLSYVPSADGLSFCVTSSRLDTTKTFSVDKTGTVREGACPASVAAATPESCFTTAMMTGKITIIGYNGYGMSSQQGQNPECPNDVVIPSTIGGKTVNVIESGAFASAHITSVVFPSTLTNIWDYAFYDNDLTSVTFPASVTQIGDYSFSKNKLTSVSLPTTVNIMGMAAFNDNQLPDSQAFIYDRTAADTEDKAVLVGYGGAKRTNITIPSTVTRISSGAFDANQLGIVTIPSSVTTISASFAGNDNVTCRIPTGKTFTTASTGCKTIVNY